MSWFQYNTTPGGNTSVDGINVAEGMPPGNVNNAMRAMMADSRKFQLDNGGAPVTGGTGDNYTLAVNQNFTGYAAGMRFTFRLNRANVTNAPTITVNATGSRSLLIYRDGAAVPPLAGDLPQNAIVDAVWSPADNGMVILNRYRIRPGDISSFGNSIIGRPEAGFGTHSNIALGNGIGFSGTSLVALIGDGLSFVSQRITAAVSRFSTVPEARAGVNSVSAMSPAGVAQYADANIIGMGQAWRNVTADRSAGTTYTNATGRPIQVNVRFQSGTLEAAVPGSGGNWITIGAAEQNPDGRQFQSAIIPNGHVYRVLASSIITWSELR